MTTPDLDQLALLLAALHPDDKDAIAYDHASHGPCPFEDSDIECPVCPVESTANEYDAFFGALQ